MHGCLLINKEKGYTCQDVCNLVKRKLNVKKVGHCGTLDPFAEGLLIVGINEGTKVLSFLEKHDKTYLATLQLGIQTSTADYTGEILVNQEVPCLNKQQIQEVFKNMIGKQQQVPPMYSAIKINGKKLYEYARKNIEVERKARKIEIYSLEFVDYQAPNLTFRVNCSKGTYIRTLGEEIAKKLNTVGHLITLTRESIDNFKLSNAKKINELSIEKLINIKDVVPFLVYPVEGQLLQDIKNGKRVKLDTDSTEVLCIDQNQIALAIYQKENEQIYRCLRGFHYESV